MATESEASIHADRTGIQDHLSPEVMEELFELTRQRLKEREMRDQGWELRETEYVTSLMGEGKYEGNEGEGMDKGE